MHLVDDKHLDADSFQKPQRRLLHLDDVGARTLWRAQQREQFGIEAPLSWLADHFHGQHRGSLRARIGIEARRILVTESFHDHCLAHAAVAVYGDRGHACSPGVVNQATEVIERLFRTRIEDPATGFDRSNSFFVGL